MTAGQECVRYILACLGINSSAVEMLSDSEIAQLAEQCDSEGNLKDGWRDVADPIMTGLLDELRDKKAEPDFESTEG